MERNYPRFRPITKFKLISFENILYSYRIDFHEESYISIFINSFAFKNFCRTKD